MPDRLTRIVCVGRDAHVRRSLANMLEQGGFLAAECSPDELPETRATLCVAVGGVGPAEAPRWQRFFEHEHGKFIPVLHVVDPLQDGLQALNSADAAFTATARLAAPVDRLALLATVKALVRESSMRNGEPTTRASAQAESSAESILIERAEAAEEHARERSAKVHDLEHEINALERFFAAPVAAFTAPLYDGASLRSALPDIFADFTARMEQALDLAMAQRIHRTAQPRTEKLQGMANQLGFLRATPRDVIDIYCAALTNKTADASEAKLQVVSEEGRLLVLELMGYLASYYRTFCTGVARRSAPDASCSEQSHA